MKVSFHGHSVVLVTFNNEIKLIIDPFIKNNPDCDLDIDTLDINYIVVTHAHEDHLGDTVELAKRNNATVITTVEIATYLENIYNISTHGMQPGGSFKFPFGLIKITPAIHGSSIEIDNIPHTLGIATGVIISDNNKTIYHLGDTALFSDLRLIGRQNDIDLAFIPIGDNFTMGPDEAVLAAEWLQAKKVVPIHYNTFPLIKQDPVNFIEKLLPNVGIVPKIGSAIKF